MNLIYKTAQSCTTSIFRKSTSTSKNSTKLKVPNPARLVMRCMGVLLMFVTVNICAQSTANYTPATGTNGSLALDLNGNAVDLSTGATSLVAAGLDDTQSTLGAIGFDYYFMGTRYAQFSASDNGLIGLGAQPGTGSYSLPNGTIATISAFANDMRVGTNGIVRSKVVGTAPNRCLVVEWSNNMIRYLGTAAAGTGTFQVRLYETTGVIEFVYGAMTTNTASPTVYYVGFSNSTTANNVLTGNTTNNSINTTATPTTNAYTASSTITALNSTANGSRRFYRFTPPTTTAPSGLNFTNVQQGSLTLNWANNGSNRIGTAVYTSTDNVTFTYAGQAAAAATSFAVTGLTAGTLYYFRLYAVSEGFTGAPLAGNQATTSAVPLTGTKTIDNTIPTGGNNFISFTDAVASLTVNGVGTGGVTFNVTAGQTFTETVPAITFTGTAANPVIFQKNGAAANPVIVSAGSTGTEAGILISGGDYLTFDGINITASGTALEFGYYMQNASAVNGAQNNTIKNCTVTLNRNNTASIALVQFITATTPTAATGANSNNKYYNLTVKNAAAGILLQGNPAFPDLNTEVGTTACALRNTIGDPVTSDDITYTGAAGGAIYGIKATNQSAVKIFNNDISNISSSINNSVIDGIFIDNSAATVALGTSDIYGNKISGLFNTGAGTNANTYVRGIRANGNAFAATITRIYNNFVTNLQTGNNATSGRRIQGISLQPAGGGAASSIYCEFNSVRLAVTNLTPINTCFEIGTASGPVFRVRNNIFANFTAAQSGTAKHYTWVTTSATSVGNTGSLSNYNDLYVTGTNGFIGLGNATDYATLANWQTGVGQDANSVSVDPIFASATDLHVSASALNAAADPAYATNTAWVTVDIDCQTRPAATDIGADEVSGCNGAVGGTASGTTAFCGSGTPAITASGYSTGIGTGYQWEFSNDNFVTNVNDVTGQTNPASLSTGTVTTTTYYRLRVTCPTGTTTAYSTTVTITINALPATVTVSGGGTFCGTATITAANGNDGTIYFQGTTSNGTSTATPSVSETITVSGTYYFRALSAAGCWGTQGSTAVVINAIPATPTVTPSANTVICLGASQALTVNGTLNGTSPILQQNFESGLGAWVVTAGSSGGTTPALANFNIRAHGFAGGSGGGTTFNSPGGSNFILADPDAAGSGVVLNTQLTSPVFSTVGFTAASLSFRHYYRHITTNQTVQLSTDGGATWANTLVTYSSTQGTATNFTTATISLNAYLNQANLKVRFNYTGGYLYYWAIDDISIGGTPAPRYSWTASPSADAGLPGTAGTPLTTNASITATPTAPGSYTYTAVVTNFATGCVSAPASTGLVTVNPNYTITASAGANGSISPNGATTLSCDGTGDQAYTITPAACYSIADVLVDGVSVGAVGTYTFTNVTANHTISATFVQTTYTITATSGANGTVTPAGASTVNCGDDATYTITPAACYAIADVLVDGVSNAAAIASGTFTFTNVTANHTISATFVQTTYTITATSGANGTVTPAGASTVNCGNDATYTITPAACYAIADVLVDGVSNAGAIATGTFTFTNVTATHTISATFVQTTYTITATSGANGSVTPAGASTVNCGDDATYTITPAACYAIADVLVDGVSNAGAIAAGTFTFTNVTANHTISASFVLTTYTITASSGSNGTVTPAGASTVNCGDDATYTITPAACYQIADVLVDGVSNAGAIASGTFTFTNVTANHTISATFVQTTYTITATSGANGTVTPAGASTVNCGDDATYTITPAACYQIADVLVDGVSNAAAIASGTFTFTNVTANHTISATFVQTTYTITATSGANGTVTPNGASTVNCGDDATYTITPAACYQIADVLVDGVSNSGAIATGTFTFTNVTANHTISATFVQTTYTITATSGANGLVTPAGAFTVNCGDDATYSITPAACYHVNDVLVDGVSVGAVTTYTFTNVQANHTISASFVADAPLTAPVITGPVNSCQYIGTGEGVTYTFNSPGATGYSYVLPPNTMLQSSTANSITITFQNGFAAQGNRQIRVTALSACGNSPVGIFYLAAQAPVTPSQIVGNTNVCAIIGTANTYTYTIPSVPGASSYNWTAQSGTTTISHPNGLGVNDTTITISFTNGFTTSNLTVAAVNGCSSSTARSLTIQRINPTVPALISGPTNVCENILPAGTPATYRIVKVAGATSYNWTVTPNTAVVTHPNGSGVLDTVITVTFQAGFTSGTVTVSASNGCGTSGVRSLSLVRLTPGSPSAFDVIQLTQCPNRSYSYTLPSLPANTTSLQWTVPTSQGAVITSQTATSITVSYPATAVNGTVTVTAVNNCGSSQPRSVQVKLAVCADAPPPPPPFAKDGITPTGSPATESFSVNVFPNPSVADFKLQVLTAGKEKVNVRILDMQGRVYKQFTVMPYQATTIGSELKAGAYLLEVTQGSTVKTTKLLKF